MRPAAVGASSSAIAPRMRTLTDIDWTTWAPTMRGTLLFVFDGDRVLLIRKKRGLGAGLINAPGGKIDPGETALQSAERELWEEVGVQALATEEVGELSFQFVDGLRLHVQVFRSRTFRGEAVETDEALPMWVSTDALPYDEMWADDRVWIPRMLAGRPFHLRGLFDGLVMLDHAIEPG